MGADLYIRSIYKLTLEKYEPAFKEAVRLRDAAKEGTPEHDRYQQMVEEAYNKLMGDGYYRDPYNSNSIALQLGFSWWKDVIPLLDEDGKLQPPNIKLLLNRVVKATVKQPTVTWLHENHCKVDDDKNSVESWREHWEERHKELIAFLGMALDRNEPIDCSL